MNLRETSMLAIAAMLLGGFIYFYEIEGELDRRSALDDQRRIFPGLAAESVTQIELGTQDGVAARFERGEVRWQLAVPVASLADSGALEAMAHALTHLPRAGTVVDAGELDQYGLGSEARVIHFVADGQTFALRIGRSTPVGGHVYVARHSDGKGAESRSEDNEDKDGLADFDRVDYVERYRINAFNKTLDDFRERRIVDIEAAELRGLRIVWASAAGTAGVTLLRDSSNDWQIQAPIVGAADQQTLHDLISNLSFLRANSFIDGSSDEIEAALANPELTIHWTLRGDERERRVRIGSLETAPDGGVIVEGPEGQRFSIEAERLDDFERSVAAYRFKKVSEPESR